MRPTKDSEGVDWFMVCMCLHALCTFNSNLSSFAIHSCACKGSLEPPEYSYEVIPVIIVLAMIVMCFLYMHTIKKLSI